MSVILNSTSEYRSTRQNRILEVSNDQSAESVPSVGDRLFVLKGRILRICYFFGFHASDCKTKTIFLLSNDFIG